MSGIQGVEVLTANNHDIVINNIVSGVVASVFRWIAILYYPRFSALGDPPGIKDDTKILTLLKTKF